MLDHETDRFPASDIAAHGFVAPFVHGDMDRAVDNEPFCRLSYLGCSSLSKYADALFRPTPAVSTVSAEFRFLVFVLVHHAGLSLFCMRHLRLTVVVVHSGGAFHLHVAVVLIHGDITLHLHSTVDVFHGHVLHLHLTHGHPAMIHHGHRAATFLCGGQVNRVFLRHVEHLVPNLGGKS